MGFIFSLAQTASAPQTGKMAAYIETLPNSAVKIQMTVVPGGSYKSGDKTIDVKPFYMARTEVVWEAFDQFLALIQVNVVLSGAHKTVIGIAHLTGTVNHATHYPNFEMTQVTKMFFYPLCGFLKIKQGAATTRTRDKLSFGHSHPGVLKDSKTKILAFSKSDAFVIIA